MQICRLIWTCLEERERDALWASSSARPVDLGGTWDGERDTRVLKVLLVLNNSTFLLLLLLH